MGFGRRGTEQQAVAAPPSVAPEEPADIAAPVAAPEAPQDAAPEVPEAVPATPDPEPTTPKSEPKAKPLEFKAKALKGIEELGVSPQPMTATMNEKLAEIKITVFNDLLEAVDLAEISKLSANEVREEITDMVAEIISRRGLALTVPEHQQVVVDICNDILGLGPLEPLLMRDDIADIMVNGAGQVWIETKGKIELTDLKFRDNAQLMNICQRIVTAVGRRVDEASPICDARLEDGSRVNVIVKPLSIDGPALTIRKFSKEKLTLDKLVEFGALTEELAQVLQVAAASRCNILISGGTGSGKTTLLNCLTSYIDPGERIITCDVVRLETRPPNLEGVGEISMRDLVKNCLRMRPERIIVGEVRGPEAFDLLQAMNTGHDGSMGTVHANNPREGLSRIENMIAMGGYSLPAKAVREQISAASISSFRRSACATALVRSPM